MKLIDVTNVQNDLTYKKRIAVIEMLRDYAKANDIGIHYDDGEYRKSTTFQLLKKDGLCHTIVIYWEDIENVYEAFKAIVNKIEGKEEKKEMKNIKYDHDDSVLPQVLVDAIIMKQRSKMSSNALPKIKQVIFNNPATIVFWTDDTKTIVKAINEKFDPEKGLAMAIAKKCLGNKGNYFNEFKKWIREEDLNGESVNSGKAKEFTSATIGNFGLE